MWIITWFWTISYMRTYILKCISVDTQALKRQFSAFRDRQGKVSAGCVGFLKIARYCGTFLLRTCLFSANYSSSVPHSPPPPPPKHVSDLTFVQFYHRFCPKWLLGFGITGSFDLSSSAAAKYHNLVIRIHLRLLFVVDEDCNWCLLCVQYINAFARNSNTSFDVLKLYDCLLTKHWWTRSAFAL